MTEIKGKNQFTYNKGLIIILLAMNPHVHCFYRDMSSHLETAVTPSRYKLIKLMIKHVQNVSVLALSL